VRSFGLGCLGGGLGRTLLATSSGFTITNNLGLSISQSRAIKPLFGCVACTFLGRALVFVRPVVHAGIQIQHGTVDGGTAQWERKLHDREAGDWFESKVKLSLKANQVLTAT
jgi:hypothetical protein